MMRGMNSFAADLSGKLVDLSPIAASDADGLWAAVDHDAVWAWMPIGRPDRARFDRFFEFLLAENAADRMSTWIVRWRATGAVVGSSSFLAIRREHRGVEIGYTMYDPGFWGTGANVEAKLLMMIHGFETHGLQRIEFKTDARNERSRGALAALPAQFEGIFRRHMDTAQGVRDSAYFSVVDAEWAEVNAALVARLER